MSTSTQSRAATPARAASTWNPPRAWESETRMWSATRGECVRPTVLWMDHTENEVCPGRCAEQQQEPRALKTGHLRDPVQEDSTFFDLLGQLPFNEVCATQGSAKNCDPLLVTGKSWVSSPHIVRCAISSTKQMFAIRRPVSAPVTLESCCPTIGSPPTVPPWPLGLATS